MKKYSVLLEKRKAGNLLFGLFDSFPDKIIGQDSKTMSNSCRIMKLRNSISSLPH